MIRKIALMCVLAILCLCYIDANAQKLEIVSYHIGERMPDLPLKNIINYKDSAGSLSQFGNKLIILDFWNTHCTSCIKMFPLEDSLQSMFVDDIQFILVTGDSKMKVEGFLEKYNATEKNRLELPIVVGDQILNKLFQFTYIPHYVWIAPNGQILAQTSDSFINSESILKVLRPIRAEQKRLEGNRFADLNLHMQKPDKNIIEILKLTDNL